MNVIEVATAAVKEVQPPPETGLTLPQVIERICAGRPITWVTVYGDDGVYDMAIG
jgi:hypothetical protein